MSYYIKILAYRIFFPLLLLQENVDDDGDQSNTDHSESHCHQSFDKYSKGIICEKKKKNTFRLLSCHLVSEGWFN